MSTGMDLAQGICEPRVMRFKIGTGTQRGHPEEPPMNTQRKDTILISQKKQMKYSRFALHKGSELFKDERDQCIFEGFGFGRKDPLRREVLAMSSERMRAKPESSERRHSSRACLE